MNTAKSKKAVKVAARRRLRRELKRTEGFTKVGASFSRQNYGDGMFRGAMADKVGYSHA